MLPPSLPPSLPLSLPPFPLNHSLPAPLSLPLPLPLSPSLSLPLSLSPSLSLSNSITLHRPSRGTGTFGQSGRTSTSRYCLPVDSDGLGLTRTFSYSIRRRQHRQLVTIGVSRKLVFFSPRFNSNRCTRPNLTEQAIETPTDVRADDARGAQGT